MDMFYYRSVYGHVLGRVSRYGFCQGFPRYDFMPCFGRVLDMVY